MHLVLSLIFCGCMKSFKDSWMDYIEDHLDYVRVLNHIGGDHESERTRPYREKIMDYFGPIEIVFESDAPKFANRLKTRMAWMFACSTEIGRNSALPTIVVVAVLTEQIACGKSDAMSLLRIQSQRVGLVLDGWDQKMQSIGPDN